MALRINYNYESVSAQRNLSGTQSSFFKAIEQLSSGLRINKASDDAAGLAVSEKLKNQVRGLNQAQRNAQDGVSLIQTAEGALNETHSLLSRMRELAVQSANDTLSNSDRAHLQAEVNQLLSEVDRIGTATQFNNVVLLNNNTAVGSFKFHIGANAETTSMVGANEVSLYSSTLNATAAGLSITTVNVSTQTASNAVISALDAAVETVSTQRGLMGAMQNRLEHSIESLGVASENAGAANQAPQMALQLLK